MAMMLERDYLAMLRSLKIETIVAQTGRRQHGDPVFHDLYIHSSKLGLRQTLMSKPEWKECPPAKEPSDPSEILDSENTAANPGPAPKPRCSLMDLPNEVLIMIADYIVFPAIDSIDDPCGFYWPSDANITTNTNPDTRFSYILPGALHHLQSTISPPHERSPPAANYIGTSFKLPVIDPTETYWFAITSDHYWRWLWKQLGFAHTNTLLRELVLGQVDKWIPIVDQKHHKCFKRDMTGLALSNEEVAVEHEGLKGAVEFLKEAAGVGRVRERDEVEIMRERKKQVRKGVRIVLRGQKYSFEDGN